VFLERFWDYEKSVYVREKAAHGQRLGRLHCYLTGLHVARYWKPFFGDEKKLNEVTRADLREFSFWLCEKELASESVNKIMRGGTTALTWAYREELLAVNPCAGLASFTGGKRKPGILTPAEAVAVFEAVWLDKRAWAASLLAVTTGLRAGEIAALRVQDIGEKVVYIRHSWSRLDGLKAPKNGEARQAPLLTEVRAVLLDLMRENPFLKSENPFVFYGTSARRPMSTDIFRAGFQAVCRSLGIDVDGRKIVFHSHRHYYAARMTDRMTAEQVSRITGHKSRAVFDEYAGHITERNLVDMGEAGAAVFDNILNAVKFPPR
jgi:integrase